MWGSSEECFKHSLVAWEKVCSPLVMGGLGVRKLGHFNQALLGKWLWRFGQEGTSLWQRVIAIKYGEDQGGWNTKVCRRAHGCGLWHGINVGWERFSKHLAFVVGDGFVFGMISGLRISLLKCSILSYLRVLVTDRKSVV